LYITDAVNVQRSYNQIPNSMARVRRCVVNEREKRYTWTCRERESFV